MVSRCRLRPAALRGRLRSWAGTRFDCSPPRLSGCRCTTSTTNRATSSSIFPVLPLPPAEKRRRSTSCPGRTPVPARPCAPHGHPAGGGPASSSTTDRVRCTAFLRRTSPASHRHQRYDKLTSSKRPQSSCLSRRSRASPPKQTDSRLSWTAGWSVPAHHRRTVRRADDPFVTADGTVQSKTVRARTSTTSLQDTSCTGLRTCSASESRAAPELHSRRCWPVFSASMKTESKFAFGQRDRLEHRAGEPRRSIGVPDCVRSSASRPPRAARQSLRVDAAVRRETFCHGQRGVPAVGADLEQRRASRL